MARNGPVGVDDRAAVSVRQHACLCANLRGSVLNLQSMAVEGLHLRKGPGTCFIRPRSGFVDCVNTRLA